MAATALSPAVRLSAHSFASCSGRAESRPSSRPRGAFTPASLSNRSSLLSVSGQQVIASRGVITKRRDNGSAVRAAFPGLGDDYLIPGEYDISSIPSEFRRENLPEECEWMTSFTAFLEPESLAGICKLSKRLGASFLIIFLLCVGMQSNFRKKQTFLVHKGQGLHAVANLVACHSGSDWSASLTGPFDSLVDSNWSHPACAP